MENASKALIMAGGVLIALIIVSLLVSFFANIRNLRNTEETEDVISQSIEFNKQYEAFNRSIYGSELVSIARKIEDYNERESDREDYTRITFEVTFSPSAVNKLDPKHEFKDDLRFEAGKYSSEEIVELMDKIDFKIKNYTRADSAYSIKNINGITTWKTIKELAGMRTNDIKKLYGLDKEEELPPEFDRIQKEINIYNSLKTLFTTIKSTKFKCTSFEYDKNNGRVTKMGYEV